MDIPEPEEIHSVFLYDTKPESYYCPKCRFNYPKPDVVPGVRFYGIRHEPVDPLKVWEDQIDPNFFIKCCFWDIDGREVPTCENILT